MTKKHNKTAPDQTQRQVPQQPATHPSTLPRTMVTQSQVPPRPSSSAPGFKDRVARSLASPKFQRRAPVVIAFIIGLLPSIFFYHQAQTAQQNSTHPVAANLQSTNDIVNAVSRHIVLPSGEQPTVATVSDASKVHNQAFFEHAANSDKVLIYAQAKKAYLYRPSIDRVIEVAPLAPNTTATPSQPSQ